MLWWYVDRGWSDGSYVVIHVWEPRMALSSWIIRRILIRVFSMQVSAGRPKRIASPLIFLRRSWTFMYVVVSASSTALSFHLKEGAGDKAGDFRMPENVLGGREGVEGDISARAGGGGVVAGGGGSLEISSGAVAIVSGAGVWCGGGGLCLPSSVFGGEPNRLWVCGMVFLPALEFGGLRGGGVRDRLLLFFFPAVVGSTGLSVGFLLPLKSESFAGVPWPFFVFGRSLAAFLEAEGGFGSGEEEKRLAVPLGGIRDGVCGDARGGVFLAGGSGGVLGSDEVVAGVLGGWACSVMCSCFTLMVEKDLSIVDIWKEGSYLFGLSDGK